MGKGKLFRTPVASSCRPSVVHGARDPYDTSHKTAGPRTGGCVPSVSVASTAVPLAISALELHISHDVKMAPALRAAHDDCPGDTWACTSPFGKGRGGFL